MQAKAVGLSTYILNWDQARLSQSPHGQQALAGLLAYEHNVLTEKPVHLLDSIGRRFLKRSTDPRLDGKNMLAAKQAVASISTPDFWKKYDFAIAAGRIENYSREAIATTLASGAGTIAGFLQNVERDRATLAQNAIHLRRQPFGELQIKQQDAYFAQIEQSRDVLLQIALSGPVNNFDRLGSEIVSKLIKPKQIPLENYNTQLACCDCSSTAMHVAAHQALIKNSGDLVILPSGSFEILIAAPGAVGGNAVVLDSKANDYKLDPVVLEEYLKSLQGAKVASVVITDPTNPSGKKYTKEELEGIGKLAIEYGFKVIVDEHFSGLDLAEPHQRSPHANCSFAALSVEISGTTHKLFDHSITIQGTTKITGSEAMQIGFAMSGNTDLIGEIQSNLNSRMFQLTEYQLMRTLDFVPGRLNNLDDSLKFLRRSRREFTGILNGAQKSTSGNPLQELSTPDFGFFSLFGVDAETGSRNGIVNDRGLAEFLLKEHGIGVRPVDGMFLDQSNRSVRVNFSDSEESAIRAFVKAFKDFK